MEVLSFVLTSGKLVIFQGWQPKKGPLIDGWFLRCSVCGSKLI